MNGIARFSGRTVLIFGGAKGIGAAAAKRVAAEGAKLMIADIAEERGREVAQSVIREGGRAEFVTCDIGRADLVRSAVARTLETFGALDAAFVNAADLSFLAKDTTVEDVPLEVFDQTLRINLRGHLLAARNCIPALLLAGGGSIVFTGSRAGLTSEVQRVSYATSKAGINALSRHIALAYGKRGIRSNVIAPGTTLTEPLMAFGAAYVEERLKVTPSKRLGTPDDIAAAAAFLMSSDAEFINGQILSVDGGATMR